MSDCELIIKYAHNLKDFNTISHGFSTRLGGVSDKPYASLNLGLNTLDDKEKVVQNRKLFTDALNVDLRKCVTAEQVHSTNVSVVDTKHCGRGVSDYRNAVPNTDALITATPGVGLMMFYADCIPILLYDHVKKVIAVVHGGWRGTVGQITKKTVDCLYNEFGTDPKDIYAAIGPGIGMCCYEVDEKVAAHLSDLYFDRSVLCKCGHDKFKLDLKQYNKKQLINAGVTSERISVSEMCTSCNTKFFYSHRKENGKTGRIGAFLIIKDN